MEKFNLQTPKGVIQRISKPTAKKLFKQGVMIILAPCKLLPYTEWNVQVEIEHSTHEDFDKAVNHYQWYNCNLNETGYYPSFYKKIS
jgi:hypothetical protein